MYKVKSNICRSFRSLSLSAGMLSLAVAALAFLPYGVASNLTKTSAFNEGVQAYNQKQYSEALKKFKALAQSGMNTDKVHYYMALCYQGQNQIALAKAEYSLVLAQSRDSGLRSHSQRALASIDHWNLHRSYQGNGNIFQRYSIASRSSIMAQMRAGSGGASATPQQQDADCPPSG